MKTELLILLAACLATSPALAIQTQPDRAVVVPRGEPGAAELSERIAILRKTSAELRAAARQPVPEKLTPAELAQAKDYNAWLRVSARRMDALASEGERLLKAGGLSETAMSFDLQYLQLQSQMQHENRSYTAISNIMKTKHDTVKNSISNVR